MEKIDQKWEYFIKDIEWRFDMNKIFYCRVGWMRSYCGAVDEKPVNGGSYNKD